MPAGHKAHLRGGEAREREGALRGGVVPAPGHLQVVVQQHGGEHGSAAIAVRSGPAPFLVHTDVHAGHGAGLRHRHVLGQQPGGRPEGALSVPHHSGGKAGPALQLYHPEPDDRVARGRVLGGLRRRSTSVFPARGLRRANRAVAGQRILEIPRVYRWRSRLWAHSQAGRLRGQRERQERPRAFGRVHPQNRRETKR